MATDNPAAGAVASGTRLTTCGRHGDDWLNDAHRVPSPNCDARPPGTQVELVVIHAISLPPQQFGSGDVRRFFTNQLDPAAHPYYATIADLRVSAHFLIERSGDLTQFVALSARAWHAGQSLWCGREACNDFSLGIELEGCDELAFTESQYRRLATLLQQLMVRYPGLLPAAVVGHADIAPGRKTDPGPNFDWPRVRRDLGA